MQSFLEQMQKLKHAEDGQRSMLTLVEKRGSTTEKWLWRCECGTVKLIKANYVLRQQTKSCGCLQKKQDYGRKNKIDNQE